MSLKDLAQQVRSEGRGKDTMLVHLTPNEVGGLQSLAKAAGGSLTINPKTGLPEAGFLESLLPTILGFAANFIVPGSGAIVGGLAGAAQNKENPLMGALMGGLGGYGGGNIAGALSGAAAPAAAAQAIANPAMAGQAVATGGSSQAAMLAAQNAGFGAEGLQQLAQAAGGTAPTAAQTAGLGVQALGTEVGRDAALQSLGGGMGALKSAGMAAAPGMMAQPDPVKEREYGDLPEYDYTAGLTGDYYGMDGDNSTRERQYFTQPTFTRRMAEGGETDPAKGMTGASAEAMRYLMGRTSASPATVAAQQRQQTLQAPTPSAVTAASSEQYVYDPRTHSVVNNPAYKPVKDKLVGSMLQFMGGDGGYDGGFGGNSGSSDMGSDAGGFGDTGWSAGGGIASLAQGGFVVPADVVSMAGEGNTDAGYERLKRMLPGASPIKGKDGGQADTVKTSIDGKQPARVAHGEMYVPPATVKRAGGAKKLYAMMDNVRKQAKGDAKQIRPVNLRKAMA